MIDNGDLGLTDQSNVTPVKSAKKSFVQTTFVPNESQQYVPPSGNKVSEKFVSNFHAAKIVSTQK